MESFRTDSAHDRLTALRRPIPSSTSSGRIFSNRALMLIAAIAAVVVLAMAIFLTQRSAPVLPTAEPVSTVPSVDVPDALLDGESYVALAAEVGTFPPSLSAGDTVRVVVVPSFDSGQLTRSLDDVALIRDVTPPSELGNSFVITVRAPLAVAVAIADAQKIHLAVVEEATP
jgi:hypothetical protein